MTKKFLAKLLIFCMIFTMLPVSAFGATPAAKANDSYTIQFDNESLTLSLDTEASKTGTVTATLKNADNKTYEVGSDCTIVWTLPKDTTAVELTNADKATVTVTAKAATTTSITLTATVTRSDVVIATGTVPVTVTEKAVEGQQVTVKFYTNGGPVYLDQTAKVGDIITLPAPTKEGYTFKGWTTVDPETVTGAVSLIHAGEWTVAAPADGTVITLYANWTPNAIGGGSIYTVVINGGDVHMLTVGEKTTLKAVLWKNKGFDDESIKELTEINKDARLTWSVENIVTADNTDAAVKDVVTISPSGETCTVTANKVEEETGVVIIATLAVPKTETKTETDKDGKVTTTTTQVKDENGKVVYETLDEETYTIWVTPDEYTIAMDETGTVKLLVNGTAAEKAITMKATVKRNDKVEDDMSYPIVWTSSDNKIAEVNENGVVTAKGYGRATITATLSGTSVKATRYVNVEYKPVTVKFDPNYNDSEGKPVAAVELKTNTQGKLEKLADRLPDRDGYMFMTWCVNPDSDKTPVTVDKIYTEDTTLYAYWEKIVPMKAEVGSVENGTLTAKITGTFNGLATEVEETSSSAIKPNGNKVTFIIATPSGNTVKEVTAEIDAVTAASLGKATTVELQTSIATIELDSNALQKLSNAGYKTSGNFKLTAATKDVNSATDHKSHKDLIKGIYDFSLKDPSNNDVLPVDTKAEVTVKLKVEGIANQVFVYYFNNNLYDKIVNAKANNGEVTFTTNHFSDYVVSAEPLVYVIKFLPGTGAGTMDVQNVPIPSADENGNKIAKNIQLNKNEFTKSGYVFSYWTPGKYDNQATIDVSGDMTLTANWKERETGNPDNSGSSGGGGGGSSSNVSIATKVTGGNVTVSPSRPTRGQTVTLNVKPADGYKLDTLTVTDSKGNTIELTKVSDDKYTFVMPAGKVTVTPTFVKIDGTDKKDETTNVSKRFSDVASDAWYAEYINYVAENGLMNGYEDGRFGPNDQTTRAQIVTVLYRMEGEPAVQNSNNFSDVSAGGQYYSSAVAWAARNNIVNGYEDGRFGPNDNVTREQIAAILYRYAAYKEFDTTLTTSLANFSDAARVSGWAQNAIAWAVAEGLMNGDNGALRPQGNATRAEIAALLMRFSENIAK